MKRLVLLFLVCIFIPTFLETSYRQNTEVIQVTDFFNGLQTVYFKADNGYIYSITSAECWNVDDKAILTISDNRTAYRIDDDIVKRAERQ